MADEVFPNIFNDGELEAGAGIAPAPAGNGDLIGPAAAANGAANTATVVEAEALPAAGEPVPADPCALSQQRAGDVEATKVDEWLEPVEAKLTHALGQADFERLRDFLKEAGAVIAGGFILSSVSPYIAEWGSLKEQDVDIYVPIDKTREFIKNGVITNGPKKFYDAGEYTAYNSSLYCSSFLRKNKIKRVYRFTSRYSNDIPINLDVMSVRKSRTPQKVASNFDLTFCQVWYDGCNVYATHPSDIREKKGVLQGDYVPTFLSGNEFLRNRIKKYTTRGFAIKLDPDALAAAGAEQILIKGSADCNRASRDDEMYKNWVKRGLLKYSNEIVKAGGAMNSPFPLSDKYNIRTQSANAATPRGRDITMLYSLDNINTFKDTDIYDEDSEDEDTIMRKIPLVYDNEADKAKELITPLTKETAEARFKTAVYIESMFDDIAVNPDKAEHLIKNNMRVLETASKYHEAKTIPKFMDVLREELLVKGDDFIGGDGHLFHIHHHPMDGGITRDSLMGYLEGHVGDIDKDSVPCFWQPNATPESHENCRERLTLKEVNAIVYSGDDKEESHTFFKRYAKKAKIKGGLDQTVGFYDGVLDNSKKADPLGFGDIFEKSVCPFCLQFEDRSEGCAYLTHANPKLLNGTNAPFCLKHFVVQEIGNKYVAAAFSFDPNAAQLMHLEFCVECGRPSEGHKHFDFAEYPAYVPAPTKTLPNGQEVNDYGRCAGGGRPELLARILAIRDVYAEGITDAKVERERAAFAAEAAASGDAARIQAMFPKKDGEEDVAYTARTDFLARGTAIFEKELAERKWNNEIPAGERQYNNANDDSNNGVNQNNNSSNNNNGNQENWNNNFPEEGEEENWAAAAEWMAENPENAMGGGAKKGSAFRRTKKVRKVKKDNVRVKSIKHKRKNFIRAEINKLRN